MRNVKAQSAIEFLLLVGVVLFLTLGFMSVFQKDVARKGAEKREFEMQELMRSVQNEINIAAGSADGYIREFEIPDRIVGKEYSIGIYDGYVYLNTTDGMHAMAVPTHNVTGQLRKGANLIRTINNSVFVN